MLMFKTTVKRCVTSEQNHAWMNVVLPAVETVDSNGEYKVVVDPKLSSQDILDVLKENWDEQYLCRNMLTRFIAVLADNSTRTALGNFCKDNPSATQEQKNEFMQAYMDSGWNLDLKHPATRRQTESQAKTAEKAEDYMLNKASEDEQIRIAKKTFAKNPEVLKALNALTN